MSMGSAAASEVGAPLPTVQGSGRCATAGGYRALALPLAVAVAVFAISFGVRLAELDRTVTADEGYWMQRSIRFGAALARFDPASTLRAGHPGVTVMWTGLLGMGAEQASGYFGSRYAAYEILQRAPDYLDLLSSARRAVALVVAVLIAASVLLAWRLLGGGPAVVGGAILTLDPYLIGMTRLLHVDALLAPLMTVSALAGLVALATAEPSARRWPYLLLSCVAGGLALLTKAPSVFLLGFVGLVALAGVGAALRRDGAAGALRAGWPYLLWLAGAAGVAVLLFPALWVDPLDQLATLAAFVKAVGLQPHDGNFFLGRPVLDDPGPLYYLVALPLRVSPLAALGLALLVLPALPAERRGAARWLIAYVALFVGLMTLGAKKFDRYALPAQMVVDLLAGVGLWRLALLAHGRWSGGGARSARSQAGLAGAVVALVAGAQVVLLARVWPYPIAYYNPLAGGPARAQQLIMVGWGEGLEQVAAYLNDLPDAASLFVVTNYNHVVRPHFVGTTAAMAPYLLAEARRGLPPPDYLVLYVNAVQRRQISPEVARAEQAGAPVFVAYVNGLPYAWVYRLPRTGPRPDGPPVPAPIDERGEGAEN